MNKTIRFAQRFWWAALITALLVDVLFWGKAPGISFPLWISIAITGLFLLARSEGVRPARASWLLAALALIAALFTFLRSEVLTRFVNGGLALGAITLLAATFTNGHWTTYRLGDHIIALLNLVVAAITRPIGLFSDAFKPTEGAPQENNWKILTRQVLPVLRGLLLAVPVVIVLGALLASADPIFSDTLNNYLRFFDLKRVPEYLFRLFYIIFVLTYLFTGIYAHAIRPDRPAQRPDWNKNWVKPFLGTTEGNVVLICVDLLFVLFVLIQFRYFFGGQANINVSGYTYSEYARRGFGELVAVAVLSLMLYLSLSTITRQLTRSAQLSFTVLAVLLMTEVIVILNSAFQRLLLYENVYGFTQFRTYPHVFMIWLGILMVATIVFEIIQRRQFFTLALMLAVFGFGFTLAGISVDALIVRQNVQRVSQGYALDAFYIQNLSSEAVPEMVRLYSDDALPQETHQALGIQLGCRTALMQNRQPQPWQSFLMSENNADYWLLQYKYTWKEYEARMEDGTGWVVDIKGETIPCRQNRNIAD